MRKLLLSFFLILGVNLVVSAQPVTPTVNFPDANVTKTSFLAVMSPQSQTTTKSYIVKVTGGGINKTLTLANDQTYVGAQFSNLKPGTQYTVQAQATSCPVATALTCATKSSWSTASYVKTKVDFPPAATLNLEGNCPQFIGLNWTVPNTGGPVTNFTIKKSFGGPWYHVVDLPPYERSYYDGDVTPGVHVTYAIFTQNELNEVQESNNVSTQIKPYLAPDAPINLRVDSAYTTNNTIRIAWDNPAEDWACKTNIRDAWYILVKRQYESDYSVWAYTYPQSIYFDITGLEQNEPIDIRMWAVSDQGIQGGQANISAKTWGVSTKPSNVIGVSFIDKVGNSAIGVSWDHPQYDADYFVVEYSVDGVNYMKLADLKPDQKVINHINISEGLLYTYRVKAANYKYGESEWAYMDGYVSHDYTKVPNTPYGLRASWSGDDVVLNWVDDSNKEEKYVIERATAADGDFEMIGEVGRSITTYTDQAPSADSLYYRVYAENPLGESATSKVAKIFKAASTTGIVAYPNPTVDRLNISIPDASLKGEEVMVSVYNQADRLVLTKKYSSKISSDINMRKLPSGLYNVVIKIGDYQESKKIYKQ